MAFNMNGIGNLIWLVFGGLIIAIEYVIASFFLMITIIGIPFGIQTLKLAALALWPFGKVITTHHRAGGCLSIFMNILWILIGGFWIAVTHLFFGVLLAITIVGLPFAQQHFKLAGLALTPFGKDVN
jgi:uncharacterized membrane protein YccF (DUF307 family)